MQATAATAVAGDAKPRRRFLQRRNYLINKPFQLALAGSMLLIAAVGMLAASLAVSWIFLYVLDDHLSSACMDDRYIIKIGIMLVCVSAGILIWMVLRTHAIAGPIYKARRILQAAAEGHFPDRPVGFRRGDAFKDLAVDLNHCLTVMRADHERLQRLESATPGDADQPKEPLI